MIYSSCQAINPFAAGNTQLCGTIFVFVVEQIYFVVEQTSLQELWIIRQL